MKEQRSRDMAVYPIPSTAPFPDIQRINEVEQAVTRIGELDGQIDQSGDDFLTQQRLRSERDDILVDSLLTRALSKTRGVGLRQSEKDPNGSVLITVKTGKGASHFKKTYPVKFVSDGRTPEKQAVVDRARVIIAGSRS